MNDVLTPYTQNARTGWDPLNVTLDPESPWAVTDGNPETYDLHGLKWPVSMPLAQAELFLWKHWDRLPARYRDALEHPRHLYALSGARRLLTEAQITFDPWCIRLFKIWTYHRFAPVLGAASCGKSNTFGLMSCLWWMVDPTKTYVLTCSTTREMLELRIWEAVLRYFYALKALGAPGHLSRKRMAIINEEDDSDADDGNEYTTKTVKASIKGVAVQQGSEADARSNLIGGHLPYVVLVLDEAQATRAAAAQSRFNLRQGTLDFRFYPMGNPTHTRDLLCSLATPRFGGWDSVTIDTGEWDVEGGRAFHFDAFKSPALESAEVEAKYPYLPRREQIEQSLEEVGGNADDPRILEYVRGFPPSDGRAPVVLPMAEIERNNAKSTEVAWISDPEAVLSIDPAFSEDNDAPMAVILEAGIGWDPTLPEHTPPDAAAPVLKLPSTGFSQPMIRVRKAWKLVLKSSDPRTFLEQLVSQVVEACSEHQIPIDRIVCDDAGNQSLADAIEMYYGRPGVSRFVGSHSPRMFDEESPSGEVSASDKSKRRYRDRATESWFRVARLVRHGQLKGMTQAMALQISSRLVPVGWPKAMEPKKKYKERIKRSPDDMDALSMGTEKICEVCSIIAGQQKFSVVQAEISDFDPSGLGEFRETDADAYSSTQWSEN